MKVLSSDQIKALDAYTIAHEPVASLDLMERACRAFCSWFSQHIDDLKKIGIVCGTGNNGGDGLGIARLLHDWGYTVKVWIVRGSVTETDDFKKNRERLPEEVEVTQITSAPAANEFAGCNVLIDALFGSGLSRPVEGIYAQVIEAVNQTDATRIAVDIPSGLFADKPSEGAIIKANYTVSFQLPKLAFFMPENHPFVGAWTMVDIGLSKEFINQSETTNYLLSKKHLKKNLKPRSTFDHKGRFGHALLIAGSYGKMGAAVLASRAALRSGAGLLTTHIPRQGNTILQSAVPEAMVSVDDDDAYFTRVPELDTYNAVGVGPGIGTNTMVTKALEQLMERYKKPMVLDADALTILSANPALQALIPEGSILTPHPGEFKRLAGDWKNSFDRLERQRKLAVNLKSVLIVKGAYSSIAAPSGKVFFNNTGNPGMAKGGSGDALTGMLTALLARGYTAVEAAQLGCWLHGLAGDLAMREKGVEGLITSDLIEKIPEAIQAIQ
ncbi:MAG: NAD(P)H-hydrate dehydratase [Flammeovirgaceae bacterium]|nr:MAG: NAD(P)H-hydrate dehydratase [Flammeovirgaceae bacterium]